MSELQRRSESASRHGLGALPGRARHERLSASTIDARQHRLVQRPAGANPRGDSAGRNLRRAAERRANRQRPDHAARSAAGRADLHHPGGSRGERAPGRNAADGRQPPGRRAGKQPPARTDAGAGAARAQSQRDRQRTAGETDIEAVLDLAAENFNEALGAVHTRVYLEPGCLSEKHNHDQALKLAPSALVAAVAQVHGWSCHRSRAAHRARLHVRALRHLRPGRAKREVVRHANRH